MPRSIGRVARPASGSDGRVARKTWCYCRKSARPFFGGRHDRRDISRGSRFSIPRPLTRPGGDSWFVKACRRPAALLHHRPSDGPLGRRFEVFARFLGRGRTAASLFARCPLGCNGVIITILKSSFPANPADAPFSPRKALVPPHFFGDFIRAWRRIENWVV